jgi:hypothetical protein
MESQDSLADRAVLTPPPSSQRPLSQISTPPPTVETASQAEKAVASNALATMSPDDLSTAAPELLRATITELQAALGEAKMSAAHHKLQYNMQAQESKAQLERMNVETQMAQEEHRVMWSARRARATPVQQPPRLQDGMIPVQKEWYQRMCRDIQQLTESNQAFHAEHKYQQRLIERQEGEIASLSDKVALLRERIRVKSKQLKKLGDGGASYIGSTPRSMYSTPHRAHGRQDHNQHNQPFAALLQASEMMVAANRKGHNRNTHSTSSLPSTPQRMPKQPPLLNTPSGRQPSLKMPSTAPMPRTSALRTPGDVYSQPALPAPHSRGPPSEGTVSNSERDQGPNDNDSEAETDILEPEDDDHVAGSQASRAASQMLRTSQEQDAKRSSFTSRSSMLGRDSASTSAAGGLRQTKLFGSIRKRAVAREDDPPAKRQRTTGAEPRAVGLGIAGVRD